MRKLYCILGLLVSLALHAGEAPSYTFPPATASQAADPSNVVWVDQTATGGAGTEGNPWTGWDTAITWTAWTEYRFPKGYYGYATSPNFCLEGLALVGEQGAVLKYTGTDKAVNFSAADDTWVFFNRMENLRVQGHANADYGLWLVGLRSACFRNVKIYDFKEAALTTKSCVANVFDNIYIPHDATTKPKNGVVLDARPNQQTTVCNFINLIVEGATEKGIYIKNSFWNNFYGGAAENLAGKGLVIDPNSGGVNNDENVFIGFDFELNNQVLAGDNVEINGNQQQFYNCNCTGTFHLKPGWNHLVVGGLFQHVTVDAGTTAPTFIGLRYTGTYTDNTGGEVISLGSRSTAGVAIPFTPPAFAYKSTDWKSATSYGDRVIPTDASQANMTPVIADDNFTLGNPTNPKNGQRYIWRISQDGTGSRTITLGSAFNTGPWTVTLSTVANKTDYLEAIYNSSTSKWDIVNFQKGY